MIVSHTTGSVFSRVAFDGNTEPISNSKSVIAKTALDALDRTSKHTLPEDASAFHWHQRRS